MAGSCRGKFPREKHGSGLPPIRCDSGGVGKSPPLACIAYVWTPNPQEADKLRRALKPLLQTIDPEFNLLSIGDYCSMYGHLDSEVILNHLQMKEGNLHKDGSVCLNKLRTPSLNFVLMVQEEDCSKANQQFQELPWKFHHKIELSTRKGQKIKNIAKQEFYQPGPGLPLWAICPIHFGSQHLRYTIFTRNFSAMMDFYRILTGKEVEHVTMNFCLFELFSIKNTSVQLALKESSQLHPSPCRTATLCFRVQSTEYLQTLLSGASFERIPGSLLCSICDPDGNCLLIEQVKNYDVVKNNAAIEDKNKTSATRTHKGQIAFGEWWSETSSFDSGQHSSSFNSIMESTVSEDADSCISDIDSSEFDSPLWPQSLNLTPIHRIVAGAAHQRVTPAGAGDEWRDPKQSKKHASKACKPWELSSEHDSWLDTLTTDPSWRKSIRHETKPSISRTEVEPFLRTSRPGAQPVTTRRDYFM